MTTIDREVAKWESVYEDYTLPPVGAEMQSIYLELAEYVRKILRDEHEATTLEAGCGTGLHSLALARAGFKVELLDFSANALNIARAIFQRAGLEGRFHEGDVMVEDRLANYDFVFNSGVLEHYGFEEQVRFLQAMARRSRRFVLVLVPNRECYWYWIWRVRQQSLSNWPWGYEKPASDYTRVFSDAGLQLIDTSYYGCEWTERNFITSLDLPGDLRTTVQEIHKAGIADVRVRAYLVGFLGVKKEFSATLDSAIKANALSSAHEQDRIDLALAHAADSLSVMIAEKTQHNTQITSFTHAVADREEKIRNLTTALSEREGEIANLLKTVVDIEAAVAGRDSEIATLHQAMTGLQGQMALITNSAGWGLLRVLWRLRLCISPRGSLRERILLSGIHALRALKPKKLIRLFHMNGRTTEPSTDRENSASTHRHSDTDAFFGSELRKSPLAFKHNGRNSEEKKALGNFRSAFSIPATKTQNLRIFIARRIEQVARRVLPPAWRAYLRPLWLNATDFLKKGLSEHSGERFFLPFTDSFGIPISYDVICFPIIEWDHRFQRPQQLMTLFARGGHRVFYFNLTFHDHGAHVECRPLADRIFQVRLPGPTNLNRFFESLPPNATSKCLSALAEFCAESGIKDAICMVQLPFWTPLALGLRQRYGWKVIFDCMDEHQGLTILQPEILQNEFELVRQADLVVVSAQKLWDKHAKQASRCLLLPNATDFEHFSQATNEHELDRLPHPIIGYHGAIMEWFDAEMVIGAAKTRPDWSFVLIGNVDTPSVDPLRRLPNVYLLGEKPYSSLPGYLHQFDVCLIPFKLTAIIQSTNPVKFYEYLSAGKPVVAVPMPELVPYQDFCYMARNALELVAEVERALREDNPLRADLRIQWARQQTWQARYQCLTASVEEVHGLVTIVIVSYHNFEKIQMCIESIIDKTHYPRYEVIVVDNGSTSEVIKYLELMSQKNPNLRVIFNQENLGFARANNIGLQAMREDSRYIVLLNNDTVVTRGWLTGLIHWLRDPEVGLVGPVTCPNGAANEAAIMADYCDLNGLESFVCRWTVKHHGNAFDIPMLAMFCLAMRREVYEKVGPLDEQFEVGMFEDDDYSLRVQRKGYRVICAEDVFIHHFGRASFSQIDNNEYKKLFEKNRQRFEAKWNIKWRCHSGR